MNTPAVGHVLTLRYRIGKAQYETQAIILSITTNSDTAAHADMTMVLAGGLTLRHEKDGDYWSLGVGVRDHVEIVESLPIAVARFFS